MLRACVESLHGAASTQFLEFEGRRTWRADLQQRLQDCLPARAQHLQAGTARSTFYMYVTQTKYSMRLMRNELHINDALRQEHSPSTQLLERQRCARTLHGLTNSRTF